MSLLDDAMESFKFKDRITVPDGYGGGVNTAWVDGAGFQATAVEMQPNEVIAAEQSGVKATYKIITKKNVTLMYGAIVQRLSDGKYFQIKSDGTDKKTPASASLDMRSVKAEEIKTLPDL